MTRLPTRVTLIFDGECGFCTRSVRLVRALDRHNRITAIPYQHPDAEAIFGVNPAEGAVSVWAVTPEGERYRGAAAVNAVLSVMLGTRLPWLIYRLPGMAWMQEWVYDWVARHRSRLPGDRPHCQQHPEDCGTRS